MTACQKCQTMPGLAHRLLVLCSFEEVSSMISRERQCSLEEGFKNGNHESGSHRTLWVQQQKSAHRSLTSPADWKAAPS